MQTHNTAYLQYTPEENRKKIFIGKSTINIILFISLISSMGYWYVLGIQSSTATGIFQILAFSLIGLGLATELLKKITLSLFRKKSLWFGATFVSVLTVMGTLSVIDNKKETGLIQNSDQYKTAQARQNNALDSASSWAWASGYNLEALNNEIITLTAKRERREISYQAYLAQKRSIKEKITAKQNYQSSLNMQTLAGGIMANSENFSTSSNPLLSNIALATGATATILKTLFYLSVTLLLEFGAWFLGGEVEKLERALNWSKKQFLDHEIKKVYGDQASFILGNNSPPALENHTLENNYLIFANGKQKTEKMGVSAEAIINSILEHLKTQNLIEKYAGVELKAINASDKKDRYSYTINRPTLTKKNTAIPNFLKTSKSPLSSPKKGNPPAILSPKQGKEKNLPLNKTKGGSRGKRGKETADTGIEGENSQRYQAIKKAILAGEIEGKYQEVKDFIYGGVGMGSGIATKYRKALKKEKII